MDLSLTPIGGKPLSGAISSPTTFSLPSAIAPSKVQKRISRASRGQRHRSKHDHTFPFDPTVFRKPLSAVAEALWGELLQLASPSNPAAPVDVVKISKLLSVSPDVIEAALAQLLAIGALLSPDAIGLRKLASGKRLPGEFIFLSSRGTFFRVIEPDQIRQRVLVHVELLRREDEELCAGQKQAAEVIMRDAMPNALRDTWIKRQGGSPEHADAQWRVEWLRMREDPDYFSKESSTHFQQVFKMYTRGILDSMKGIQDQIHERRKAIAAQLAEPLLIPSPRWESNTASKQLREAIPKSVAREVWRRDQGRCVQCSSKEKLEFDHIIPVSKGGATTVRNLQLLCEACNRRKNNRI